MCSNGYGRHTYWVQGRGTRTWGCQSVAIPATYQRPGFVIQKERPTASNNGLPRHPGSIPSPVRDSVLYPQIPVGRPCNACLATTCSAAGCKLITLACNSFNSHGKALFLRLASWRMQHAHFGLDSTAAASCTHPGGGHH